jgi:hypothetical protein
MPGVDPGGTQPCRDLIWAQVPWDHLAERGDIGVEARVVGRRHLGRRDLDAHIAGQVFRRRHQALCPRVVEY